MKFKPAHKPGEVIMELKSGDALPAPARDDSSPIQLKRILVPTDFSDCSRQALRYAVPFAKEFGAALHLLYVVQVNYPTPEMVDFNLPQYEADMRRSAEKQLSVLAGQEIAGATPTQLVVRSGSPFQEIIRAAETLDIDLIIIATHGRSGLAHVLLGSTAERVVRHAPCPVFVVRQKEHEFVFPDRAVAARPVATSDGKAASASRN